MVAMPEGPLTLSFSPKGEGTTPEAPQSGPFSFGGEGQDEGAFPPFADLELLA